MANKYIIQGATYCGDGTTSASAASNGAAGAWNNANVWTGTAPAYGALNAGDLITLRGKTAAGADITITVSANTSIGKSGLTSASLPVTWVLDDGTVWSGITGGVLTFNVTGAYTLTPLAYNEFDATVQDAIVISLSSSSNNSTRMLYPQEGSVCRKWKFDTSILTTTGQLGPFIDVTGNGRVTLDRIHIVHNVRYQKLFNVASYTNLLLIEPDIEANSALETDPLFYPLSYGSRIEIRGGRVRGAGATSGVSLCTSGTASQGIFGIGFSFPYAMTVAAALPAIAAGPIKYEFIAMDSTINGFGSVSMDGYGVLDTRDAGFYPKLNATLPDSASTAWSYMLAPGATCSTAMQKTLDIAKPFLATAATATVTLNLLVSTSFSAVSKANVWAVISYVDDTTGNTVVMSTQDHAGGALDSTTAAWSNEVAGVVSYGPVAFDKRKLAITTPSTIKQDSIIRATLYWGTPMVTAGADIAIIDPDIQLS